MKTLLLILFLVPIVSFGQNSTNGFIKGTEVNLRAEPNLKAEILGQLNTGDEVEILHIEFTINNKYPYWYKIKTLENKVGYVYFTLVQLAKASKEIKETVFYFDNEGSEARAIKFSNQIPMSYPLLEKIFPNETIDFSEEFNNDDELIGFLFSINEIKIRVSNTGLNKNPDGTLTDLFITSILIQSESISDIYGLRIGDTYEDIKNKRGAQINTFPGHHIVSVSITPYDIFYEVSGETGHDINGPDVSPEDFSVEMIKKYNWGIDSISWPSPQW
ncbi:MAG: SH3 domain-containing protein [Flammeovirgaceae bacterium]|nr:SH3 domain-containing protein [Flammeovirgaceae bacterium]|tara:strand:+ start:4182 stop:5003 length:822 start_codon:yes stop_codon:yes gene_type:complete